MTTQEKRKQLMIAGIEKRRQQKIHKRKRQKITALATLIAIFVVSLGAIYSAGAKEITLTEINEFDGTNETVTVKTRSDSVSEVLNQAGYSIGEADKVNKSETDKLEDNDDIVIKRGKQITIKSNAGDIVANITTVDTTDALIEAGYVPGEFDEVTTSGKSLAESDTIEILAVSSVSETEKSQIASQTEYIEDSSLAKGETRVVSEGANGVKATTYSVVYKDGAEVSREAVSEDIITPVKNTVIAKGTKESIVNSSKSFSSRSMTSSSSDTGKTINGMSYSKKITMTATAYSTSPSENGGYSVSAMGNPLGFGIVAIDPSIVPLGSKVYVEAADGSWTYGTASAEDTGGAIKGNRIDLCYNGSVSEVNKFGRRSCVVYILK